MEKQNLETLIDTEASGVLGYVGDLHGNMNKFDETNKKLKDKANGKTYDLVISDVNNLELIYSLAPKYEINDPSMMKIAYVNQRILETDEEKDAYSKIETVSSNGGIENYIQLLMQEIPNLDIDAEIKDIEEKYALFQELKIEEKLKGISEDKLKEFQFYAVLNQIKAIALDEAVGDYFADQLAEKIDPEENIRVWVEPGNHAKINTAEKLRERVKDKNKIKNVYDYEGAIAIGEGKDQIKFQATGNVYFPKQKIDLIAYGEEGVTKLYPHMYEGINIRRDLQVDEVKNASKEELEKSNEYKRITKNLKEKELDLLIEHSETGQAIGWDKEKYMNIDDIGIAKVVLNYLKPQKNYDDQSVVLAGHLHSEAEGSKEDYKNYTIRNFASMTYKENGELKVEKIEVDKTKPEYDLEKIDKLYQAHFIKLQKEVFGEVIEMKPEQSESYKQAA